MSHHVYIIAEAGVNHNGQVNLAKELIDVAVAAAADAVKFQTFRAETLVCRQTSMAEYQKKNTRSEQSQFEMIKSLELNDDDYRNLYEYCRTKNIDFISTPFDLRSIDFLIDLGVDIIKIPSGEITNLPYLQKIGSSGKKVILSTGMASLGEIEEAVAVLENADASRNDIHLLHCNTEYPTPYEDVNLNAMLTMKHAFPGNSVGYSDHTLGIEVPIAAVALGARIIEKHFTLDKTMSGPDHKASLDPIELKSMVNSIRNIEFAMGSGIKKASPSEMKNIPVARKSIVAETVIKRGELFSEKNIAVKRLGYSGISPMRWHEVIGKKAPKDFYPDEAIEV